MGRKYPDDMAEKRRQRRVAKRETDREIAGERRCGDCRGELVACQTHTVTDEACFACWNGEPCPVCWPEYAGTVLWPCAEGVETGGE